jgi:hypothetical protein
MSLLHQGLSVVLGCSQLRAVSVDHRADGEIESFPIEKHHYASNNARVHIDVQHQISLTAHTLLKGIFQSRRLCLRQRRRNSGCAKADMALICEQLEIIPSQRRKRGEAVFGNKKFKQLLNQETRFGNSWAQVGYSRLSFFEETFQGCQFVCNTISTVCRFSSIQQSFCPVAQGTGDKSSRFR